MRGRGNLVSADSAQPQTRPAVYWTSYPLSSRWQTCRPSRTRTDSRTKETIPKQHSSLHSQQTKQQTPPSVSHPRSPPSDCAPSSRSLTPPFPCSLAQVKKTLHALAQQSTRKASDARRHASGPSSFPSTSSSTSNPPSRPSPFPPDTQQRTSRPPDLRSSLKKRELSTPPPPFALPSTPSPAPSSATGPSPPPSPQAAGSAAAAAGRSTSLIRQAAERARTQRHLEFSRLEDSEEVGTGGRERGRAGTGGLGSSTSRVIGESSYLFPPRERVRSFLLHLHCRSTSRKGLI